ncbi:MAG: GSCFA domain-containing protein [Muribaculum sp.]|nr:GSCFA domain-containing protein [Muribaculum sp.]
MKFRTEYLPVKSGLVLDPGHPVVLVGSCFASNIAEKMRECRWNAFNGVGTLYNPLSIAKVLDLLVFAGDSAEIVKDSLFRSEGYVHSWLFDSHFSRMSESECLAEIERVGKALVETLENAQTLIVTFGTSWCYFLNEKENYVVANCHKMPQSMFTRRRVSVEEISPLWIDLCGRLKKRFPDLSIMFTVSPVRHLKDGFEGNARSKAMLLLAVEEICGNVEDAMYFPAYEIVTDDLRDYRFYASDLVHPSEQAVEYLWEIFIGTFLDENGEQMLKEGSKAYKRLNHRPIKK